MSKVHHPSPLDPLDRKILRVLQSEAGISHAELSQRVAASPASCWRRIKAMEVAGILRETVRLVDPISIGRGLSVFCQVRIKSHDPSARQRFEAIVQSRDEVMECHTMSREWDYLLRVVGESIQE